MANPCVLIASHSQYCLHVSFRVYQNGIANKFHVPLKIDELNEVCKLGLVLTFTRMGTTVKSKIQKLLENYELSDSGGVEAALAVASPLEHSTELDEFLAGLSKHREEHDEDDDGATDVTSEPDRVCVFGCHVFLSIMSKAPIGMHATFASFMLRLRMWRGPATGVHSTYTLSARCCSLWPTTSLSLLPLSRQCGARTFRLQSCKAT